MQNIVLPARPGLSKGYFGRTIDAALIRKPVVTLDEILDTLPASRRTPNQRIALSGFPNLYPAKYFAPVRGVLCSSAPGRWPTWAEVLGVTHPFYARVLAALSPAHARHVKALAETLSGRSYTTTRAQVNEALRWLKAKGLAFKVEGGNTWGCLPAAAQPIDPGPRAQALQAVQAERTALEYLLS